MFLTELAAKRSYPHVTIGDNFLISDSVKIGKGGYELVTR